MRTIVDRGVHIELQEAMDYYRRNAGLRAAARLFTEFKRCKILLGRSPRAFPVIRDDIRRLNLHRFPYHILYKVLDDSILIVKLKHDTEAGQVDAESSNAYFTGSTRASSSNS